jgi:TRAP-type C4-dicarboxylate transport system permease small subunit
MNWLDKAENRIGRLLEIVISLFFVVILATTIIMVILRYVFNTGIYGGNELISYLFVYTTALGAAVSIGKDEHIKITVAVNLFPEKIQKIIESFSIFLVGLLNLVLVFLSVSWIQKVGSFESPTLRIPNAWVQFGVPLGCSMAVIFCVFRIIRILRGEEHVASTD